MQKHSLFANHRRLIVFTATCLILSGSVFALTIDSAVAVGSQLTITGTGFSGTPTVVFNKSTLTVVSTTSTQIVATINPLPPAGTYRLAVKAGDSADVTFVTISNIIAKISLLNQSASISPTTLLTPEANGLFRISVYMVQAPPYPTGCMGICGTVTLSFQWTDDAGLQAYLGNDTATLELIDATICAEDSGGTCPPITATYLIQSQASTPIVYNVNYGVNPNANGTAAYDLFMTIEQLI